MMALTFPAAYHNLQYDSFSLMLLFCFVVVNNFFLFFFFYEFPPVFQSQPSNYCAAMRLFPRSLWLRPLFKRNKAVRVGDALLYKLFHLYAKLCRLEK